MKWSLFFVCVYLSAYDAAYVDTLKQCPVKDGNCLKDLIQNILKDISKDGIKDYDIPPIDPIDLIDINIPVFNLINLTLPEVSVMGLKDCVVTGAQVLIQKRKAVFDLNCDVVANGKHKVEGSSPILQNFLGSDSVSSDGNFKLKISKLHLTLTFTYDVIKKEDGQIYFRCKPEEFRYKYDVGGFNVAADKIYLGKNDASKVVVDFLNQNWKFIIKSVGDSFFEVAMKIFYDILHRFFDNTPAKYYIKDDLTNFIKSDA